jgi:hypothetical protein
MKIRVLLALIVSTLLLLLPAAAVSLCVNELAEPSVQSCLALINVLVAVLG